MIKKNLTNYFPMLKSREEILAEIMEKPRCNRIYQKWTSEQQKHFLDFCSGTGERRNCKCRGAKNWVSVSRPEKRMLFCGFAFKAV